MTNILEESKTIKQYLQTWRQALHQIPETGMHLPETIAYICKELDAMQISYRILDHGAGILAQIGMASSPCILLRADMDALPIKEESGEAFASINGNMHACGHDLHATMLLGAARLLKAKENEIQGCVKLLFQSGEEIMEGAKAAIQNHILENPHVDAGFATHVISNIPVGVLAYGEHAASSSTLFEIHVQGKGGHGSMPELCIDPIQAAVMIYQSFQSLIARECGVSEEVILTFGQLSAGNSTNIIPDAALLKGTLRTYDKKKREYIKQRMQEIIQGISLTTRTTITLDILNEMDDLHCDPVLNEFFANSIQELNPEFKMINQLHTSASEDFAAIAECIPSSYFAIGAAIDTPQNCYGQHHPKVRFHEDALVIGCAAYTKAALDYIEKQS